MVAVVTNKASGSSRTVAGNDVILSGPSVVKLSLNPNAISEYQRIGDDLLIRLHNGETVRIVNFYTHYQDGQDNDLVLQDEDGKLWAGSHSDGLADFNFSEIQSVDQLAGGGGDLGPVLLGLLGLGAVGAAIAASSGSDDDNDADTEAPSAPSVTVGEDGRTITIKGEPNSTATIYNAAGDVIGTVVLSGDGTATFTLPSSNGQNVTVTLTDGSGNESSETPVTLPDTLAPNAPTDLVVSNDGSQLSGKGEPGAKVIVRDPNGNIIGEGTVDQNGNFTIDLNPPQDDGCLLYTSPSPRD